MERSFTTSRQRKAQDRAKGRPPGESARGPEFPGSRADVSRLISGLRAPRRSSRTRRNGRRPCRIAGKRRSWPSASAPGRRRPGRRTAAPPRTRSGTVSDSAKPWKLGTPKAAAVGSQHRRLPDAQVGVHHFVRVAVRNGFRAVLESHRASSPRRPARRGRTRSPRRNGLRKTGRVEFAWRLHCERGRCRIRFRLQGFHYYSKNGQNSANM